MPIYAEPGKQGYVICEESLRPEGVIVMEGYPSTPDDTATYDGSWIPPQVNVVDESHIRLRPDDIRPVVVAY